MNSASIYCVCDWLRNPELPQRKISLLLNKMFQLNEPIIFLVVNKISYQSLTVTLVFNHG